MEEHWRRKQKSIHCEIKNDQIAELNSFFFLLLRRRFFSVRAIAYNLSGFS